MSVLPLDTTLVMWYSFSYPPRYNYSCNTGHHYLGIWGIGITEARSVPVFVSLLYVPLPFGTSFLFLQLILSLPRALSLRDKDVRTVLVVCNMCDSFPPSRCDLASLFIPLVAFLLVWLLLLWISENFPYGRSLSFGIILCPYSYYIMVVAWLFWLCAIFLNVDWYLVSSHIQSFLRHCNTSCRAFTPGLQCQLCAFAYWHL